MAGLGLLGEDGRGYELARKLESHGVWRSWLGDSLYAIFAHSLSSPASWNSFINDCSSKSTAQIQLQLRARALLFDKAASLSLSAPSSSAAAAAISRLNPNYLHLHGDDVYYTLEGYVQDGPKQGPGGVATKSVASKPRSKAATGAAFRYSEKEMDIISQRFRQDEFPESWYIQFFDKHRAAYKLPLGDPEMDKRSPEQMSAYLRIVEKHKRRRVAFREDETNHAGLPFPENGSTRNPNPALNDNDDETNLFPETMFPFNCVPDGALSPINRVGKFFKVDSNGVLDTLPKIMAKSPIMIERLGIRPECLSMGQGGNHRGKNGPEGNRKLLSQEQASDLSRKIIARVLTNVGFDTSSEVPMEVLSRLLSCHIRKLGSTLRILADSYRKECSAIELVKMFLQTAGHSNLGALAELVKDNTRNSVQPTLQQIQVMRSQIQAQQQATLRQPQQNLQMPRQLHPQLQQMVQSRNLTFPQQQELEQRLLRCQAPTPRPGMNANMINNMRPLLEVKLEAPAEFPIDNNNSRYGAINARHAQMQQQFLQHPLAAAATPNFRPQTNNQYRQLASQSLQVPPSPSMSMGMGTGTVRAQPVKVEGFSELMGGDSTLKHDSEENKLTSPS